MVTVVLNREAKEQARKNFLNERDITLNVQNELQDEKLAEIQDILLDFEDVENEREFVIIGHKYKTTVTVTHIISESEIIRV